MSQQQQTHPAIVSVTAGDSRPSVNIDMLLDDRGQSRALRRTLFGIVVLTLAFLAWAVIAQVDELARARGEIQPGGHVQVLQSQEGGTIVSLHVSEGDTVIAGQVLADFAASDVDKLIAQTEIKLNALAIDRERMSAVIEGLEPDFSDFSAEYPLLVEQAEVTYREQIISREEALNAKRSEGDQQAALLDGAEREQQLVASEINEAQDRLRRLEAGARRGVVTQLALSDARQQLASLQERRSDVMARASGIRSRIAGIESELARLRADLNQELSLQLSKVNQEYRELMEEREALTERQGRIQIKSPVDGIVMNLPETSEGAVIPPGGVVAEVVPTGQDIIMEVMVMPRDIGFVQEGQRASVKIDSFDAARFGAVQGQVKRVAPTSSKLKENGMPYYKVEVALSTPYVGAQSRRLIPGMTGEADIATGQKSVIQYLLKPIFLASDTAFHER